MNDLKLEKRTKNPKRQNFISIQFYVHKPEEVALSKRFRKMCDELGYTTKDATIVAFKALLKANGF